MPPSKSLVAAFAVLLVCGAGAAPARADTYSDILCPRAVPKVIDFKAASTSNSVRKILDASTAAAEAYKTCEAEAVVRTWEEPYVNYDRTRAAEFLVVEGRALAALGEREHALQVLRDAGALASKVIEWQPLSQVYSQSSKVSVGNAAARNTDRKPSRYRDAALEVRAAAEQALVALGERRQATIPPPAPQSSPQHP